MDLTLETLLAKRDYDFRALTKKVLEGVTANLTAATQRFLKLERDVDWLAVDRLNGLPGYIVVVGSVELRAGDILDVNGEQVVITEENKRKYSNTVKFILNGKVLQHGTVNSLAQHMEFVSTVAKNCSEMELLDVLRNEVIGESHLFDDPTKEAILEKLTRPRHIESFDISDLSEPQIQALRLSASIDRGKQH